MSEWCQASRLSAHSVPSLPSITSSLRLNGQSLSLCGSLVEYACPLELHIRGGRSSLNAAW